MLSVPPPEGVPLVRCNGCYADLVPAEGIQGWRAVSGSLFCSDRIPHEPLPDVSVYFEEGSDNE